MFFHCSSACLPHCFTYIVFLPIFSLFTFPLNSTRVCSFGASFQFALVFLSHPANPAAVFFFPVYYSASCYFPGFLPLSPPSSSFHEEECSAPCLFSFSLSAFLISSWYLPGKKISREGAKEGGRIATLTEAGRQRYGVMDGSLTQCLSCLHLCCCFMLSRTATLSRF